MSVSIIELSVGLTITIDGVGRTLRAATPVTINGTADPALFRQEPVQIPAGARVRVHDFADDGSYEVMILTSTGDCTMWYQAALPAAGQPGDAKQQPVWNSLRLMANRPCVLSSDLATTNKTGESHAADAGDTPSGANDANEEKARIQAIEIVNGGTAAITVMMVRAS